jgi:hypothetical protein
MLGRTLIRNKEIRGSFKVFKRRRLKWGFLLRIILIGILKYLRFKYFISFHEFFPFGSYLNF